MHLDKKYTDFFKHLNGFRNQANRVLLAITAEPYSQYRFYAEHIQNTSHLDLQLYELKKLSYHEIKDEMQRCVTCYIAEQELSEVIRSIHSHPQAFEFMGYCIQQLRLGNDNELNSAKRLKTWQKNFNRDHKKTIRRHSDTLRNKLTIFVKELLAFKWIVTWITKLVKVLNVREWFK